MPHKPFSSKNDFEQKFWESIHFGRVVVCYGINRIIIYIFKHLFRQVAFILLILFFQIILVENSQCCKELIPFYPPNSNDDLCFLFCLYPFSMVPPYTTELESLDIFEAIIFRTSSCLVKHNFSRMSFQTETSITIHETYPLVPDVD